MKKFILAMFLLSVSGASAQEGITLTGECSNYLTVVTDPATGTGMVSPKKRFVISNDKGKTGLAVLLMMDKAKTTVICNFIALGEGNCVNEKSLLNIQFTDGTQLTLANETEPNCRGSVTAYLDKKSGLKELDELVAKKIKSVKLNTNNGHVEENFTAAQAEQFSSIINCLVSLKKG